MAIVILGGLLSSTLLNICTIPIVYSLFKTNKKNKTSKTRVIEKISQMNGGISVDLDQLVYSEKDIIELEYQLVLARLYKYEL
ncbi:MAG: hypothetical protein J7K53_10005 [Bacteroidales bacterium]|nr:hypothetical protein [Bacteroidales bacterium]